MAGDLPPITLIPLEPLGPGASASEVTGGSGGTPHSQAELTEVEPALFAVAWFIAAGDDRTAAHAIGELRAAWGRTTGLADPLHHGLQLLVPGACRLARRARPARTGSAQLDLLFTASARARAASALCEGLGLDEVDAARCLRVDRFDCASYRRHALGHARFVGVPSLVRERVSAEASRVAESGVPEHRPLRVHERRGHELRIAAIVSVLAVAAALVRVGDRPATPPGPPFVLLDDAAWQVRSATLQEPGTVRSVRAYRATPAPSGGAPPSLLVYGPVAPAPATGTPDLAAAVTTVPESTTVTPGQVRNGWQTFTVLSASCGRSFATAHGLPSTDVVDSLRTIRCTATRDVSVAAPSGTTEIVVREPSAPATTVRYERDGEQVTLSAWRSVVDIDVPAGPEATRLTRPGRPMIAEPSSFGSTLQVRARLDDAVVVVQGPASLGIDALADLLAGARRVGERAFSAAAPTTTLAPPTTRPPSTTTVERRYVVAPLPAGHRVAVATLTSAAVPWWRTLGPPGAGGAATVIEARVEPVGAGHEVDGPTVELDLDGRRVRLTTAEDRRDPARPGTDGDVELHAVWIDGEWQLHIDTAGVPQADVEALLRRAEITADAARWSTFVDAARAR